MVTGLVAATAFSHEAHDQLHRLFTDYDAWQRREFPETAMQKGDYTHADRLTDRSLAAIERRQAETLRYLERLHGLERASLDADDRLNFDLFELELRNSAEAHGFRMFLAAVGTRSGVHQALLQMPVWSRFADAGDYTNYLKRLEAGPAAIEADIELLRQGLQEGRTPPRVTLLGLEKQLTTLLDTGLATLRDPLSSFPGTMTAAQREGCTGRFDSVTLPALRAAFEKLRDFAVKEYVPHCRTSIAAVDLPDGPAYYAHRLRVQTTTDLAAKQIHEIGLAEVARIKREMMGVIRSSDYMGHRPDADALDDPALFRAFVRYLRTDPRFYHRSEDELLQSYRDICKRVDAELPKYFGVLPRLPYGVRKIPDFMAAEQTTAYYQQGDIRNAQPGWFYANTYALDQRPKYEMVALAIHEAVPGHHLQIAIAQELPELPEFRKDAWFTAFGEGWALYSERLGIAMGLYATPYDDFGRLLYEMWRACRLVVDPGMHALGWSREQAVQFMTENTALSELNINNEIDRYIAWPGQATAYKIGELKITELRRHAEDVLQARFDLRAFHDVVLGAGTLPLSILERRVQDWIEMVRSAPAGGAQR